MRKSICLVVLLVVTFTAVAATPRPDSFTPLVVSPLTSHALPFPGTDGRTHIVYELVLTNANVTPATLESIEVIDASNPSKALGTYPQTKIPGKLLHRVKLLPSIARQAACPMHRGSTAAAVDGDRSATIACC
jgi:hypothetical protein